MKLSGKPTFNHIVIKQIEIPKKTKSGIILADGKDSEGIVDLNSYDDHPHQAIVVGVGPNVTVCKEGDIIIVRPATMTMGINDKGTIYDVINEGSIMFVREGEVNEGE